MQIRDICSVGVLHMNLMQRIANFHSTFSWSALSQELLLLLA